MKHIVLAASLLLALNTAAAWAQDDDATPDQTPVEKPHEIKHHAVSQETTKDGLIQPTSSGSSGAVSGTAAGVHEGDADITSDNGIPRSQPEIPEVSPSGGSQGPNPYPNATTGNGMIVGGSVTGTGALNSAHPGQ